MNQEEYIKVIESEVAFCLKAKNLALSKIDNEIEVLEIVLAIEEKLKNTYDRHLRSVYLDFLSAIYNELGVSLKAVAYLDMSEAYFRQIDFSVIGEQSAFETKFRNGRNYFYKYRIRKSFSKENALPFDHYKHMKENLFKAHGILQNALRGAILNDKISSTIVKGYIARELAHVCIELHRWVEFSYYLEYVPNEQRDYSYYLLKMVGIDAFIKNSHADIFPSVASEMMKYGINALADHTINDKNKNSVIELLKEYTLKFGTVISTPDDLIAPSNTIATSSHAKTIGVKTKYQEWMLKNFLTLNEHSIYCNCDLVKRDNLKIRTSNSHTHKRWLSKFQILIEHLKLDFGEARLSFYNSRKKSKLSNSQIFEKRMSENQILISKRSRLLISSFKQTYSILDRIAVAMLSLFKETKDKPMYFHDFIDYIKSKVDIQSKFYLIALESISFELYHGNTNAIFRDYKEWRDAIEHNYFFLAKSDTEMDVIKAKYSDLKRITIVNESEFRNKAMHLMQLCRSSVFSLVFLIRSECCERHFKH